jgi:O-antigen ligase
MTTVPSRFQTIDYNRWLNLSFIGLAFSIPISKALTSIFTAILILLWLMQGDLKNKFKIVLHDKLSVAILILIGFSILSLFWTSDLAYAIKFIRVKYWYFLPIIIMLTSFQVRYTKYVLDAFLLSMFISEIASYGAYFGLWHIKGVTHIFPTVFMSHVDYSVYLAFAIILILVKMYEQTDKRIKLLLGIFFVTATTNLFINGGRTGQFAFVLTVFVIAVTYYRHSYKIVISSILIALFSMPLAYRFSPNFHNRINQLYTDIHNAYAHHNFDGSLATRISLWTIGINKFIDHPLLGSGIGNEMKGLDPYIKKYGFSEKNLKPYTDFHNNFIMYAVELGIGGLAVNLFIFYRIATFQIKERRYKILSTAFAIMFLSHEMGGFSFHLMDSLVLFTVFAALFNAIEYREKHGAGIDAKHS